MIESVVTYWVCLEGALGEGMSVKLELWGPMTGWSTYVLSASLLEEEDDEDLYGLHPYIVMSAMDFLT